MPTLSATTDLLRLLGDPNRVRLLALLEREELTVAELVRVTRLSQSRVSTHLARLREAGLVRLRRAGSSSYYRMRGRIPDGARRAWGFLRESARDPLLDADRERLRDVVGERSDGRTWADTVAGSFERHYSPGRTWEAALRGLLGLARLGSVLDVASGDCAIAELVAPRARAVHCLDASAVVLRAGRRRLARFGSVSFVRGDMHALPFRDASFDHVLMLACLCYAQEPERAIAEAVRVLRPEGDLVAVTLAKHEHAERVARYDHLHTGFEPDRLRSMLSGAGIRVSLCDVTSRESRAPHFEVITVHGSK